MLKFSNASIDARAIAGWKLADDMLQPSEQQASKRGRMSATANPTYL